MFHILWEIIVKYKQSDLYKIDFTSGNMANHKITKAALLSILQTFFNLISKKLVCTLRWTPTHTQKWAGISLVQRRHGFFFWHLYFILAGIKTSLANRPAFIHRHKLWRDHNLQLFKCSCTVWCCHDPFCPTRPEHCPMHVTWLMHHVMSNCYELKLLTV